MTQARLINLLDVKVRVTYCLGADQRVDIEGQEEAVEKVVGQNIV